MRIHIFNILLVLFNFSRIYRFYPHTFKSAPHAFDKYYWDRYRRNPKNTVAYAPKQLHDSSGYNFISPAFIYLSYKQIHIR